MECRLPEEGRPRDQTGRPFSGIAAENSPFVQTDLPPSVPERLRAPGLPRHQRRGVLPSRSKSKPADRKERGLLGFGSALRPQLRTVTAQDRYARAELQYRGIRIYLIRAGTTFPPRII